MKRILFTGGSGFVGKNVIPIMNEKYDLIAPSRAELDLKETDAVKEFVEKGKFDVIIHSANPNPVKNVNNDSSNTMFEDGMRIFMNFYKVSPLVDKVIYLGSGAEYDKTQDIIHIREEEVTRSLPKDIYGCTKYIMNELAAKSRNIYNLRLFACYGPYDHESKFITHCIRCCLDEKPITIRQDCYFDYIHVYDLAKVFDFAINTDLQFKDYNVASGVKISLKEIAQKVQTAMSSSQPIQVLTEGWNKEYTADISRLDRESHLKDQFIKIDDGILRQIKFERDIWNEKKSC